MRDSSWPQIRVGFMLLVLLLCGFNLAAQSFSEDAEKAAVWTAATQSEIHRSNDYTALGIISYAMALYDNDPGLDAQRAKGYPSPVGAEFRWETFNTFNHTKLADPNGAIDAGVGSAGVITGTASPMRQMQFGLRFEF